jgi:predicted O-methyltransferase YrrM
MALQPRFRLPRPLRAALRAGYRAATAPADLWALHELARAPHPDAARIASVLRGVTKRLPAGEQAVVDAIESARRAMQGREEPLVDGRQGVPPGYDMGITISQACTGSKPPVPARLLYHLVRTFAPESILELGTNVGISAAYMAAALQAAGSAGRLTTLDASPYRIALARDVHAGLGFTNIDYRVGRFVETLRPVLAELGEVDMAFIDGHHQYKPTLAYFDEIWPYARPGAVFVFDDIRLSEGMRRAWEELRVDERFALTVDVGVLGLCVGRAPGVSGRYDSRRMYSVLR